MVRRRARLPFVLVPLLLSASLAGSLASVLPAIASGVPYSVGDVFAGVGNAKIKHFDPNGALLDTLDTTSGSSEDTGMAFDLAGNLYSTNFTASSMSKFDNAGNLLGAFGSGFNSHPESVLMNAAGDFYVGQADGTHQVLKFDASGALLTSFSPAVEKRGTDWIDLAADQCTLLYTSEGKLIKRFNVCTNSQLPDFASLPITGIAPGDAAFALRIRPNQEVLVATSQEVFRLDSAGTIIQTYPKPAGETGSLFALNLDADLTSFWTAGFSTGNVYKIDVASGAVLKTFNAGISVSLAGLAVFGEITAALPKLELAPATATLQAGNTVTLTATLINVVSPGGTPVTFTVTGANPQIATVAADSGGVATLSYTGNNAGTDTVVATATTMLPPANLTSNTATIVWEKIPTSLTYTGDTTADFDDPANLSATLIDSNGNPVSGATLTFTLNGQAPCTGVTDATGSAACSLTPNEMAGVYTLTVAFAGDNRFLPSSTMVSFAATHEETSLSYTGDVVIANGGTANLSAILKEDGLVPIAGRTVSFTLGSGATAQTCSGVTDATGRAACSIAPVNQPPGPGTVTAAFAGDGFYLPASVTQATLQFQFLARGAFVIGDTQATVGTHVTYWSNKWSKLNPLSSGASAPSTFKGFAATTSTPPSCGTGWSTDTGNSPPPPDAVPPFMAVLVTSTVGQSGSTISGDTPKIVIVSTDPGYAPSPGHDGTGTVVAVLCG